MDDEKGEGLKNVAQQFCRCVNHDIMYSSACAVLGVKHSVAGDNGLGIGEIGFKIGFSSGESGKIGFKVGIIDGECGAIEAG